VVTLFDVLTSLKNLPIPCKNKIKTKQDKTKKNKNKKTQQTSLL